MPCLNTINIITVRNPYVFSLTQLFFITYLKCHVYQGTWHIFHSRANCRTFDFSHFPVDDNIKLFSYIVGCQVFFFTPKYKTLVLFAWVLLINTSEWEFPAYSLAIISIMSQTLLLLVSTTPYSRNEILMQLCLNTAL